MANEIVSKSFLKISFNPHVKSAYTFRCLNALHSPPSSPLEFSEIFGEIIGSYAFPRENYS